MNGAATDPVTLNFSNFCNKKKTKKTDNEVFACIFVLNLQIVHAFKQISNTLELCPAIFRASMCLFCGTKLSENESDLLMALDKRVRPGVIIRLFKRL